MTHPTFTLSELTELATTMLTRSNHARGRSDKERQMRIREHQDGRAYAHHDDARLIDELIASKMPRPALRLVEREQAHV